MTKMDERILIVARPGRLRDTLCALVTTIPRLEIIGQVGDRSAALKLVTEQQPGLILIDSSWPDNEVKAMLEQIKAERPRACCIVLTDNEQQQQVAISAGADEVLLKGSPAMNLLTNIEKLLSLA